MITLKNVNFKYRNGKEILKNIDLEIKEGEFISIIGKNGSGKSTLAKLLSGIIKPTSGNILVDSLEPHNKKTSLELRKNLGIVFQNPENQILFNNVYDDIAFALKNLGLEEKEKRIKDALKKVKMSEHINDSTYELSLGQKQRITIASVLAINPKYIIFDEPTTMLDSEGKEDVYSIINELHKKGYTIIYTTNVINEILNSDRIIILEQGKIVSQFNKNKIMDNIEILQKYNFQLPFIVKILNKLNKNNININLEKWNIDELTDKILEVMKNKKFN